MRTGMVKRTLTARPCVPAQPWVKVPEGVQCRVLGAPDVSYEAIAVEPSLEDGYIRLMNQARVALSLSTKAR